MSSLQENRYLDVLVARLRTDKRAAFTTVTQTIAAAMRRYGGDIWLAWRTEYGDSNTVHFYTPRKTLADIQEIGYGAGMNAMRQAFGKSGMIQVFQDWYDCLTASRQEIQRLRWDLSAGIPSDPADMVRALAESRWIRTYTVRLHPGRLPEYEKLIRSLPNTGRQTSEPVLVAQTIAGQQDEVVHFISPRSSLGGFEDMPGSGLAADSACVASTETAFHRLVPELSNPPDAIISASPGFWAPDNRER